MHQISLPQCDGFATSLEMCSYKHREEKYWGPHKPHQGFDMQVIDFWRDSPMKAARQQEVKKSYTDGIKWVATQPSVEEKIFHIKKNYIHMPTAWYQSDDWDSISLFFRLVNNQLIIHLGIWLSLHAMKNKANAGLWLSLHGKVEPRRTPVHVRYVKRIFKVKQLFRCQ